MLVCGIDEAGRGPLAGPVVAAAVVFEKGVFIENVKDSKILSEKERNVFFSRILNVCSDYCVEEIDNKEIDEINILRATMKAMHKAIINLKIKPDKFFIDGNYFKLPDNYESKIHYKTVVKGDSKIFEISCASIIAKVTRDKIMQNYGKVFPGYNFEKHKGYATAEHYSNIRKLGICEIHRLSFLKKLNFK
ncbi:MAG: ribonuclease HII [Ignavibacteria bacterium]|nr:ribonuclease HII [Ignavibacteria bacterium]